MVGPSADGGFCMHGVPFSPDLSVSSSDKGVVIRERERETEKTMITFWARMRQGWTSSIRLTPGLSEMRRASTWFRCQLAIIISTDADVPPMDLLPTMRWEAGRRVGVSWPRTSMYSLV